MSDPRLLILDEATSALDPESEALVNANLLRIARAGQWFIVSHRLSSLVDCDQILVLDKGTVADIGPHERGARALRGLSPALAAAKPAYGRRTPPFAQGHYGESNRYGQFRGRHTRLFTSDWRSAPTKPKPPALLEFESPTAALIEAPVKPAAQSVLWTMVSAVVASMAVAGLFPIDMVVTGAGRVVSLQADERRSAA